MQPDRKTEILEAFVHLVSRFGVDKTTMQDIAKEVGISVGVIYKDFKNKDELIEAYIDGIQQQFVQRCQKLCESDLPPEELLHHFVIGIFSSIYEMTCENLGVWQFFQNIETMKFLHKNHVKQEEIFRKLLELTVMIMERGVQTGVFTIEDIRVTARLFLKAFDSYWRDIFKRNGLQQSLQGIDLMYGFLIRAIRTA